MVTTSGQLALEQLGSPRILVVGDVMIDQFVRGDLRRHNPEGPRPLLNVHDSWMAAGGAGYVARLLAGFGARVELRTVVDHDAHEELNPLLTDITNHWIVDYRRETPRKIRYVTKAGEILLRVDQERLAPITDEMADRLSQAGAWDLIVVSDYGKGICTPRLVERLKRLGCRIFVDPPRVRWWEQWAHYKRVDLLKCNSVEAAAATGIDVVQQMDRAIQYLRKKLEVPSVIVTQGNMGMTMRSGADRHYTRVECEHFRDAIGAGDVVMAVLAYCLAEQKMHISSAMSIAAHAAARSVGVTGTAPLNKWDLLACLEPSGPSDSPSSGSAETAGEDSD